MTDLSKLRKNKKGQPPQIDASIDVIAHNTRSENEPLKPLQVRIPTSIFEEFSRAAGEEFGFTHGAKKQLFLKIWSEYQNKA